MPHDNATNKKNEISNYEVLGLVGIRLLVIVGEQTEFREGPHAISPRENKQGPT